MKHFIILGLFTLLSSQAYSDIRCVEINTPYGDGIYADCEIRDYMSREDQCNNACGVYFEDELTCCR